MKFPSREWFEAAADALHGDAEAQAAAREFGPVTAGVVLEKGGGLSHDFCIYARIVPGTRARLSYPEDEDELEELEPDYLARISYPLCKSLMQSEKPDPLSAILQRKIALRGDLQRLVRMAGKHQHAGERSLRTLPTEFV